MKACLAVLLASCCAAAVSPAIAGTQTGTVKDVYIRDSDGLILVNLAGTHSARPACALLTYWAIPNETTDSGKRLYALLLAAQLSGRTVIVIGKDTCSRWPDGEDIDTVGVTSS